MNCRATFPVVVIAALLSICFPHTASAQQQALDYDRDCVEGFNKLLMAGGNFRARYERARVCLELARPRLMISSTKEFRSSLKENMRIYSRVMASSALTIQLAERKLDRDLSGAAFSDFQSYMGTEYVDITPDNIDRFFDDTEVAVALGLFGGEYEASSDLGKRGIDVYSKFRGSAWMQPDDGTPGHAPEEIGGTEALTSLSTIMRADLPAFLSLAADGPKSRMVKSSCATFFAIADNPGASRSPLAIFIGEKRKEFMSAVLSTTTQLKTASSEGELAAVSCGSNLAAFFARLGDMETALKIYGEIAAVSMPTFDLDPALKKEVLPKLVGVIENPLVKGEAICALGDMYASENELEKAGQMFGTTFKLLRENQMAGRNTCWVRSACTLGRKYMQAGKYPSALGLLSGARDAAETEHVFPGEKCALGGEVAALYALGKARQMKTQYDRFLASGPSEKDFAFMLGTAGKPDIQKRLYAETKARKKPELLGLFVKGLLISADPPDRWAIAAARENAALLGEDGNLMLKSKSAKSAILTGKEAEGTAELLQYLRGVPQKRFKEEFLSTVTWLSGKGKFDAISAISDELQKAFLLDARDLGYLGDVLFKSGKYQAAARLYEKYRSKLPNSFDPTLKLARARLQAGDVAGAVEAFQAAGKYGQLTRGDIIGAANALAQQKKFDEAHAFLDAEIAADRNFADAYFTKGILYSIQGQCRKAIENYGKALYLDPAIAPAYTNMGYARLDCGDTQDAIKAFQTAISVSGNKIDHFDSNLGLAIANLRLGNDSSSAEHFKKALSLNPTLAGGVGALAKEGYIYSQAQTEDIKKLIEKFPVAK
jgi:tetratricopeptide (TPR) repeat protein